MLTDVGKDAAKRVLQLMASTTKVLPPLEVVECWADSKGTGKWDNMWKVLGQRTIENIAEGSRVLAILLESAWKHGNGDLQFKKGDLIELNSNDLRNKYIDKTFVPSYSLDNTEEYKKVCF